MAVSDRAGGAIIIWQDRRNGTDFDIYAQRISAEGNTLWAVNGVAVCAAAKDQTDPIAVSDGAGGVIIVWTDLRNTTGTETIKALFAQHLNANGAISDGIWEPNGTEVAPTTRGSAAAEPEAEIATDSEGGAIVVWTSDGCGTDDSDILGLHIDALGNRPFFRRNVCDAGGIQSEPKIVSDAAGGAIIAWRDGRAGGGGGTFYIQRVASDGDALWEAVGGISVRNPIPQGAALGDFVHLVGSTSNGAIAIFSDEGQCAALPFSSTQTFTQKFNAVGTRSNLVCTSERPGVVKRNFATTPDGFNGVIVFMQGDGSSGIAGYFAQRVDASGNRLWDAQAPLVVNTSSFIQEFPQHNAHIRRVGTAPDGSGGGIIAWTDSRSGTNIFAQRLNANDGARLWGGDGTPISTALNAQRNPFLISAGNGRVIAVWEDSRNSNSSIDLYAQLVNPDGTLGGGTPVACTGNQVRNPDFAAGSTNWTHWNPANLSFSVAGGRARLEVLSNPPDRNLQLYQTPLALTAGQRYRLQYDAFSSSGHDLRVSLVKHTSPFSIYFTAIANLGTATTTFSHTFVSGVTASDVRLRFYFGEFASIGDVFWIDNVCLSPISSGSSPTGSSNDETPTHYWVNQNIPNPFNPSTTINYALPRGSRVSLKVYNELGQEVATLVDEMQDAGVHSVEFNATSLASGVYFYRLSAGDFVEAKKLLFLK